MGRGNANIVFDGQTAILIGSRSLVSFTGTPSAKSRTECQVNGEGKIDDSAENTNPGSKWCPWGGDNLFPQRVIADIRKNTVAPRALNFKIKAHYGSGLQLFKRSFDDEGKELIKPIADATITNWLKANKINRYLMEVITDFEWFFNVFVEMIVSRDYSQVNKIRHLEATDCRWAVMDAKEKRIKHCYVSSNWPNPGKDELVKLPVIDPFWSINEVKAYLKKHRIKKFIYPTYYSTPGRAYYQEAYWNGIREGGWLEVANTVPRFKKAMMKNQATLKYHVQIPYKHWEKKFPKTQYTDDAARQQLIKTELLQLDAFLANIDHTGKAFVSHYDTDPMTGKEAPGWKIEPIENKLKDDAYLPDSQAANSEILFALGVDPSLIGHGLPGGKLGAGSGSDKREAFLIYLSLLGTERNVTLEPLEFVRDYNGWDPEIEFGFKDIKLTTLDLNPTGRENVAIE